MKIHPIQSTKPFAVILFLSGCLTGFAQQIPGLPEPGLVLYGAVTNQNGAMPVLQGNVRWAVSGGGSSATADSLIVAINGQYFYVARVPFETRSIPGGVTLAPSPNTLPLTDTPTTFTRSATVLSSNATLVPPASAGFTFGKADRGRVERVDLLVALTIDPSLDTDGDGAPNWAELIAGTNPNDANSVFRALADLEPAPGGGLIIRWSSIPGKTYSVHRTSALNATFAVLAAAVPASGSSAQYTDATATGPGPYFYRIRVNE